MEEVVKNYTPKDRQQEQQQQQPQQQQQQQPANLFALLPFHPEENNKPDDGISLRPNAKIPFIPGGITYQLKRALKKAGCNTFVTTGQKIQNVLCSRNN